MGLNKMIESETPCLVEIDDNGTLKPWDGDELLAQEWLATCNNCGIDELPKDPEKGASTGLYFCDNCEKELQGIKYFYQLSLKGALEQNIDWILKTYPEYRKYDLMKIQNQKNILEVFDTYLEGEKKLEKV